MLAGSFPWDVLQLESERERGMQWSGVVSMERAAPQQFAYHRVEFAKGKRRESRHLVLVLEM